MVADWIKIAQERSGKIRIGCADIFEDFFNHVFSFTVWARNLTAGLHGLDMFWRILDAVDGGRAAEIILLQPDTCIASSKLIVPPTLLR